jgi:hypothetical protein
MGTPHHPAFRRQAAVVVASHCAQFAFFETVSRYGLKYPLPVANLFRERRIAQSCDSSPAPRCANYPR